MLLEQRKAFLELLRGAYWNQIRDGSLFYRFAILSVLQSLDIARDKVVEGEELQDWFSQKEHQTSVSCMLRAVSAPFGIAYCRPVSCSSSISRESRCLQPLRSSRRMNMHKQYTEQILV